MTELSKDARSLLVEQTLDALPQALFVVETLRARRPNVLVNAAYTELTGYEAREAMAAGFDALAIFTEPAEVAALDPGQGEIAATERVRVRRRDGSTVPATLEVRSAQRGAGRFLVGLLAAVGSGEHGANREAAGSPAAAASAAPKHDNQIFFSWLSHELRSPLNACVMWLDVLALSPQPDKLTKAVDAIKRNLARQARLVTEVSDAAKLSSGDLTLNLEPVDVVALVRGELEAWRALAKGKQIEFQPHVELATAPLTGDPARLTQALRQLFESALASTPTNGRVELAVRAANGACAVEVTDTGGALSADDIANLGVPLWRAPTASRARSGLGLGLAVAYHVAAKHGGSLTAESTASGATFIMKLPLGTSGGVTRVAQVDRTSGS
jgi:signal transduction histidine kinase